MDAISRQRVEQGADGAIELVDVNRSFGEHKALQNICLGVRKGEFLSLLGPSGSGKTTCLKILAGMDDPDPGGDVRAGGRSLLGTAMHRRNVGVVFQSYALFPHLSVLGNVAYPLRMRRMPASDASRLTKEALELVELSGFESRFPGELSGGQQQRVALARALVFKPDFLLLDEPLAALDRRLRDQMQLQLRRIHAETGITMISVTHDQTEAMVMSDRIALLDKGRLQQLDTPEELYQQPANLFAAKFLGETNVISMEQEGAGPDGTLRLKDERGRELSGVPNPLQVQTKSVMVAIKSERVSLSPRGAGNGWSGIVREVYFQGEAHKYVVECEPQTIACRVAAGYGIPVLTAGTVVNVEIDPRDARVFARD